MPTCCRSQRPRFHVSLAAYNRMIRPVAALPAFLDRLADAAAEFDHAAFPGGGRRSRTRAAARFDPVTAADRAAEEAMRTPDQRDLPGPRHRRRGVRQRARRRRVRLGARPDRRHPLLHHRPAGLGHADRPAAARQADPRHDGAAVHRRALRRRRHARLVLRPGGDTPLDDAALRRARRRIAVHHDAGDVRAAPTAPPTIASSRPCASPATAATATPTAWSPPAMPTSSSRPACSPTTSSR